MEIKAIRIVDWSNFSMSIGGGVDWSDVLKTIGSTAVVVGIRALVVSKKSRAQLLKYRITAYPMYCITVNVVPAVARLRERLMMS